MTVADLDLVTVYCDGDTDLISLAVGEVLATNVGDVIDGTPHLDLDTDTENEVCRYNNLPEDEGFPGWPEVVRWINANRHRLT